MRPTGNSNPTSIETAGENFPTGASIELIRDLESERLSLLFTDGQTRTVGARIVYGGRAFVPINLEVHTLRAVRFSCGATDYGTTKGLFLRIRDLFVEWGFSEEVALVGTHFVFSTWFADFVSTAPCVVIAGPRSEAELFLQLLACLVRHPLRLADFNRDSLTLLMKIQPTLLIDYDLLSPSKLKWLLAANHPDSYFPSREGLTSFYSAKAINGGLQFADDSFGDAILRISLTPLRGKFPILESKTKESIANKFQSMLLDYRIRNISKVRDSSFDFPWLTTGARILARNLGACIVDDPDLQADLAPFFQRQQEANREQQRLDKRFVVIEAGLALCHGEQKEHRVYIGSFADDVNTVLKGRGHDGSLQPKELGLILRSLGLSPKRGSKGYAISFTDAVRRRIHRIAFDFDVPTLLDGKPRCPHCVEILKDGIQGNTSGPEESG